MSIRTGELIGESYILSIGESYGLGSYSSGGNLDRDMFVYVDGDGRLSR